METGAEGKWRWVVRGFPPKSWRRSRMMRNGYPFARNRSLSLPHVLDDAFARFYHNPLEDLLEGLLGLFSLGTRAQSGRALAAQEPARK